MDEWEVNVLRLRLEGAEVDPLGVPMRGTGTLLTEELPPALVAPVDSDEPADAGEVAVYSTHAVYWTGEFPDVVSSDRLRIYGEEWSVVGSPTRWPLGMVVNVRKEAREW